MKNSFGSRSLYVRRRKSIVWNIPHASNKVNLTVLLTRKLCFNWILVISESHCCLVSTFVGVKLKLHTLKWLNSLTKRAIKWKELTQVLKFKLYLIAFQLNGLTVLRWRDGNGSGGGTTVRCHNSNAIINRTPYIRQSWFELCARKLIKSFKKWPEMNELTLTHHAKPLVTAVYDRNHSTNSSSYNNKAIFGCHLTQAPISSLHECCAHFYVHLVALRTGFIT